MNLENVSNGNVNDAMGVFFVTTYLDKIIKSNHRDELVSLKKIINFIHTLATKDRRIMKKGIQLQNLGSCVFDAINTCFEVHTIFMETNEKRFQKKRLLIVVSFA